MIAVKIGKIHIKFLLYASYKIWKNFLWTGFQLLYAPNLLFVCLPPYFSLLPTYFQCDHQKYVQTKMQPLALLKFFFFFLLLRSFSLSFISISFTLICLWFSFDLFCLEFLELLKCMTWCFSLGLENHQPLSPQILFLFHSLLLVL